MASPSADGLRPLQPPNFPLVTTCLPHAIWMVIAAALAAAAVPGANAYSWNLRSNPQQCQNVTIDLIGSGGQPPFRILIIPFGPSPLPNNTEVRRIQETVFATGDQRSGSVMLNYPENSQFVAVVSDASGFGTGGTSVAMQVGTSSDSSCFDPTQNVSPDFVFSIVPPNQVVQCQAMRIWWDSSNVQGTPNFLGVIPGGQSFAIPQGPITQVQEEGTGFTWVTNVRGGTTLMLVGGDNRGNGTAGSVFSVVSSGIDNNSTCLNQDSPSSTPGSPAGMPTGVSGGGGGGGGGGGSGSNTGAVVGGVIGGLALITSLLLGLFFYRRRTRRHTGVKERPVDLLHGDEEDDEDDHPRNPNGQQQHQPDYYTPEPFMVPDPALTSDGATTAATDVQSHTGWGASSSGRPLSGTSFTRSDTPDLLGAGGGASAYGYGWVAGSTTTSTSRKGPMRMRPVNIVQHEDAGPPPQIGGDKEEEAETIELPPAYTAMRGLVIHNEDQPSHGMTHGTSTDLRPAGTVPTADTTGTS